ncbi:hypothetical protein [Crateriforma conspicua]|uniref:Secreted protein n=1 Tax=Crateriforma conspicua TaxID=2527996 RepID=A0A5C5Y7K2_9PLAN|nr:hypothetical protein [Crateriforma conspicua]TWT70918.1 hypothetical protein Pan14r_32260 [Crateriforma conspicua]
MQKPVRTATIVAVIAWLVCGPAGVAFADDATLIRITPSKEPDPALRYRFWPSPNDQRDANAAGLLSRAVLMTVQHTQHSRDNVHPGVLTDERIERWIESPWQPEHAEEMQQFLSYHESVLSEIDRAANFMRFDYPLATDQMNLTETFELLLPEVQESRTLCRFLLIRGRLEANQHRWNDFDRTVRTLYRLADMIGMQSDFLVAQLVSVAIQEQTLRLVREASEVSDSPNFYWALNAVPAELFELKRTAEKEAFAVLKVLPDAGRYPDHPMGGEASRQKLAELNQQFAAVVKMLDTGFDLQETPEASVVSGLMIATMGPSSREYLRSVSEWGDRVDELESVECVLRATALKLRRGIHDYYKWYSLPRAMRSDHLQQSESSLTDGNRSIDSQPDPAHLLLQAIAPALRAVDQASRRLEQTHHFTVTLQAIRDHAARHGELPSKLDDLYLPALPDGLRPRPFNYQRKSPNRATIERTARYSNDNETTFELQLAE